MNNYNNLSHTTWSCQVPFGLDSKISKKNNVRFRIKDCFAWYQDRTVFSPILDFLPMHKFRQCVIRYSGNKGELKETVYCTRFRFEKGVLGWIY
jgi:hypothetical protein